MPPISTPAIVLHALKYSESSKIVRLFARELGVLSVVAKGASRPRSKFGARLQLLSEGTAHIYLKPNRDLHTLAEFDVEHLRHELAADIRRYASASALAELVLRSAPTERSEEIYMRLVAYLDSLATVPAEHLETTSVSTLWGIVCALGFEPAMSGCAHDGRDIPEGAATFSIADGGLLCAACARGTHVAGSTTRLEPNDRATLACLIAGRCDEVSPLPPRHAAAHRRLLTRFVARHVSEYRDLKALTFWETLQWEVASHEVVPKEKSL